MIVSGVVRVRFAPSPMERIHAGNARAALGVFFDPVPAPGDPAAAAPESISSNPEGS